MPLLEARQISFGYRSHPPILRDWNACFESGEMVAITGPSGRGKSTLLYLLGLMLKPAAGCVRIEGIDVTSMSDAHRARFRAHSFGFVFQDAALDTSRTVIDNVIETGLYRGAPRKPTLGRAYELLEQFGVHQRASHRPGQVSGGQAQRIALCRALLNNPRIVLADEPTGNLDRESAATVITAFQAHVTTGAAVVIATHDPILIAQCTRTLVL